jgi:hypothetical protein
VDLFKKYFHMLYIIKLLVLFIAIAFSSCVTSNPTVKLSSEDQQAKWLMGQQYSEYKSDNNIKVLVSYYKSEANRLIFNVEFDNQSGAPFLVDASKFYLVGYDFYGNILDTVRAINPENQLLKLDMDIEGTRVAQANQERSNVIGSAIDVVVADELRENELALNRDRISFIRNTESALRMNRQYWEESTLRKTDLENLQYINGMVYISPITTASRYDLCISLGNDLRTAVFKFRQQVFYP